MADTITQMIAEQRVRSEESKRKARMTPEQIKEEAKQKRLLEYAKSLPLGKSVDADAVERAEKALSTKRGGEASSRVVASQVLSRGPRPVLPGENLE